MLFRSTVAIAVAAVKARKAEIDVAKQITVEPEAPLVQEIVAPQEPQVQADGRMTRVWELTGTKEQLITLARTALDLGIEYKVLGGS